MNNISKELNFYEVIIKDYKEEGNSKYGRQDIVTGFYILADTLEEAYIRFKKVEKNFIDYYERFIFEKYELVECEI